jgi:hypothetical protein
MNSRLLAPPALFLAASAALSRGRLFLALGALDIGLVFGADRTGLRSASGAGRFLIGLLGADRTRLLAASTALAFGGP